MNKIFMLTLRKKIFIICTCLWMTVIFLFSARVAEESSADSNAVIDVLGHIVFHDYDKYTEEEKSRFAASVEYPIRKLAHATEYCILGILLMGCFVDKKHSIVMYGGLSLGISACYAMSDEFHQLFVEGRSGELTDVLIDSGGALVGILITILVVKKYINFKERKNAA